MAQDAQLEAFYTHQIRSGGKGLTTMQKVAKDHKQQMARAIQYGDIMNE